MKNKRKQGKGIALKGEVWYNEKNIVKGEMSMADIRTLTDVTAAHEFYNAWCRNRPNDAQRQGDLQAPLHLMPVARETVESWFFNAAGDRLALGAYEGDRLVGMIAATVDGEGRHVGYLSYLFVDPAFRGQGIGSAMLQELAKKSSQLGCECLRLTAELDTVGFFKRRGMISTGMECDVADYTVEILVAYLDDNLYQISWLLPGQDISDALAVRRQVFGKELGYTNDPDELDPIAHTMLIHQDGKVVACGRVAPLPDGRFKLGKIALSGELRGGGMGRKLVEALEFKALELGAQEVFLSARHPAMDFYLHIGYTPCGEPFMEGPEPHTNVTKTL
jgi:predicted GNAT family N-acyltransferase